MVPWIHRRNSVQWAMLISPKLKSNSPTLTTQSLWYRMPLYRSPKLEDGWETSRVERGFNEWNFVCKRILLQSKRNRFWRMPWKDALKWCSWVISWKDALKWCLEMMRWNDWSPPIIDRWLIGAGYCWWMMINRCNDSNDSNVSKNDM